jgi:hypothetical protein
MAYTDLGGGGRIYDTGEPARLEDLLSTQEQVFLGVEKSQSKNKDIFRYAIIGVGSILILVMLAFAVKKKK